ncbi:hypothetical protein G6F57_021485 [Rhizopus arrhizus]|nr:hypothetical protein G6F57_021485 [Rhizopus arrhizus]
MADTLKEAKSCLEDADGLSEPMAAFIIATTIIRTILAVQGKTYLTEDNIFDDKEFQEAAFLQEISTRSSNPVAHLYYYHAMKAIILGFYGFSEASVRAYTAHAFCSMYIVMSTDKDVGEERQLDEGTLEH